MKLSNFLSRDNNDRVFVFQSVDKLSNHHIVHIKNRLNNEFFKKWFSHSKKIFPELLVLYNHFIIISTCESSISGCSIDSLTREIKKIAEELDIVLFDRNKISYYLSSNKINNTIETIDSVEICFLEYKDFLNKFSIDTKDIFVFDMSIKKTHDLWIISLNSWFNKYVKI